MTTLSLWKAEFNFNGNTQAWLPSDLLKQEIGYIKTSHKETDHATIQRNSRTNEKQSD